MTNRVLFGEWDIAPSDEVPLPEEPPEDLSDPRTRRVRRCDAPNLDEQHNLTIDEARQMMRSEVERYLATEKPDHMLLIAAPPGSGKTTIATQTAESEAAKGHRVGYFAPRHDMFRDLTNLADHPEWWYEWQPRKAGDPETGLGETCRHAERIASWLHRGYKGIAFCQQVCGWDYIGKICEYHRQKGQREPVIVGQHPHAWGGHPLVFSLVIGDECPLSTFTREWVIPAKWVMPPGLDRADELSHILHELSELVESDQKVEGPTLLAALGGAKRVYTACTETGLRLDVQAFTPEIHRADDVDRVPYFHLPTLVHLLSREAGASLVGAADLAKSAEYPHRVVVAGKNLILLCQQIPSESLPSHVIWLDATGKKELYETLFHRPVTVVEPRVRRQGRVIQVHDSANGKGAISDKEDSPTVKAKRLRQQADRVAERYEPGRVAIVTYLKLLDLFQDWEGPKAHFYGARGTNRLQDCDALIVIGTPCPPLDSVEKLARMVFWGRMKSFRVGGKLPWKVDWRKYQYTDEEGRGIEMPVGEFADPALQYLLWQTREAEIIQAAHRGRPNTQPIDVWLLTNLPVDELAPDVLMSVKELFGSPDGIDLYSWPKIRQVADAARKTGRPLYSTDLVKAMGVTRDSANLYLETLVRDQPDIWQWPDDFHALPRQKGPGKPSKGVVPVKRLPDAKRR